MKKLLAVIIPCIMILTGCTSKENVERFYLDEKYYGDSDYITITDSEFNKIVNDKQSFAVFIYQPLCTNSIEFNKLLDKFIEKNNMTIYKMSYEDMQKTELSEVIKYYPSFVIYEKGKLVSNLDASNDAHINYYKELDQFEDWFTKFVKLKEVDNVPNDYVEEEIDNSKNEDVKIESEIANITYDSEKVNIYFFWGDGCPHCEEEKKFFEEIKSEYGEYFNLYMFEVWYDEDNKKLLTEMAGAMGDEIKGVPYTIIGKDSFSGFATSSKADFIESILNNHKNSYDVYFDKKD